MIKFIKSKNSRFLVLGLILTIIFYMINKKFFYTALFTVIGSYLKYQRAKFRLPISAEPVFFFGILLTRIFGIQYCLVLLITAVFGVDLLVGDITMNTIISFLVQLFLNIAALLFLSQNILIFGFIVSIINMVVSIVLAGFWGVPPDRMILMPATGFLINIAYFVTLSESMEVLMLK